MTSTFNREDLYKLQGMTPRLARGLESLSQTLTDTSAAVTAGVEATQGIANATVLTLSPNDAFANERILAVGDGLGLEDDGAGNNLVIRLRYVIKTNGGYRCTFNLLADTNLTLPTDGTVATTVFPGPYANDSAAAADGVAVGEAYRLTAAAGATNGTIAWRVS